MSGGRPGARGVLITRPEPGASELAAWAAARGFAPVVSPLLEAVALHPEIAAEGLAGVVLTSAAAARAAPAGAGLRALRCWCVGEATAEAARTAGFAAARAGPSDAEALAEVILRDAAAGGRLLHLRGRHGASRLAEILLTGGVRLEEAVVYEMRAAQGLSAPAEAALRTGRVGVAAAYSPRSARLLAAALGGRFDLSGVAAVAISPAAAAPLAGAGFGSVAVAEAPTACGMRAALALHAPGAA
jgi:uroporphyrinogen-III synthase